MKGSRKWCSGLVALCMTAVSLGLMTSAILANEPNAEASGAAASPKTSSYKPYFVEFRA